MRKKLTEILEAIAGKTDEDKVWYLFLTKGAKKADAVELHDLKLIKPAGKGKKGWQATKAGFAEAGYE